MTTSTLSLSDFLLARIAEAEAWAKSQERTNHWHEPFTTARVLAKCAADRQIVENHSSGDGPEGDCYWRYGGTEDPCPTLRLLALPYADHEDYDEGWRP